jgi:hypothetical protein
MGNSLPAEVTVTERQAVHYRLPPRQLGAYRFVGLPLLIAGTILSAVPCYAAWKIAEALRLGAGDQVLLWLGAFMIGLGFFAAAWRLAGTSLFILAGRSENRAARRRAVCSRTLRSHPLDLGAFSR